MRDQAYQNLENLNIVSLGVRATPSTYYSKVLFLRKMTNAEYMKVYEEAAMSSYLNAVRILVAGGGWALSQRYINPYYRGFAGRVSVNWVVSSLLAYTAGEIQTGYFTGLGRLSLTPDGMTLRKFLNYTMPYAYHMTNRGSDSAYVLPLEEYNMAARHLVEWFETRSQLRQNTKKLDKLLHQRFKQEGDLYAIHTYGYRDDPDYTLGIMHDVLKVSAVIGMYAASNRLIPPAIGANWMDCYHNVQRAIAGMTAISLTLKWIHYLQESPTAEELMAVGARLSENGYNVSNLTLAEREVLQDHYHLDSKHNPRANVASPYWEELQPHRVYNRDGSRYVPKDEEEPKQEEE